MIGRAPAGGLHTFCSPNRRRRRLSRRYHGDIAHQWNMPVRPGVMPFSLRTGTWATTAATQPRLSFIPAWNMWHGGDFYEATPDGEIVWRHEDPRHHHDAQWLANGNLLYTAARSHARPSGPPGDRRGERKDGADGVIQSDIVTEINRKGEIVWEWKAWEHLDPADFPIHTIFDRRHWPMINGLSVTRDGLVLMSLRVTSGVIAVDKATGKVVWAYWADVVAQQHTPVETSSGSILVFDNGNLRKA